MNRQLAALLVLLALVVVGVRLTGRLEVIEIGPDCDAIDAITPSCGTEVLITDPTRIQRIREALDSLHLHWSPLKGFEDDGHGPGGAPPGLRLYLDCKCHPGAFLDCRAHGQEKIGFGFVHGSPAAQKKP